MGERGREGGRQVCVCVCVFFGDVEVRGSERGNVRGA